MAGMKFDFGSLRKMLHFCVREMRNVMIELGAASWLLRRGWLGLTETRRLISSRHLRGQGIEVGALGNPLPLPTTASALYVDRVGREESERIYPSAPTLPHVVPYLVEDGFSLPSVGLATLDFVVGNHVLEHAPDLFGALARWTDVIRPGGHIFAAVPIASECFDRTRAITDPGHFLADYRALVAGNLTEFESNTLHHCHDYLTLSCPEILREIGEPVPDCDPVEIEKRAQLMMACRADLHYHTFSLDSLRAALSIFVKEVRSNMVLAEVARSRIEIVFVLKKMDLRPSTL
jgi:SAM-dependent methyltransferase